MNGTRKYLERKYIREAFDTWNNKIDMKEPINGYETIENMT